MLNGARRWEQLMASAWTSSNNENIPVIIWRRRLCSCIIILWRYLDIFHHIHTSRHINVKISVSRTQSFGCCLTGIISSRN